MKNKARLVANGYNQEVGINYDETFTLMVRQEAIQILLAYASFINLILIGCKRWFT